MKPSKKTALLILAIALMGVGLLTFSCMTRKEADETTVVKADDEETEDGGVQAVTSGAQSVIASAAGEVTICSFNIQFVGGRKEKKHDELAAFMKPCDLVAVQELVSTPVDLTFPNGDTLAQSPIAAEFVAAMEAKGFTMHMAPEDTGQSGNHDNATRSEFPVIFYKEKRFKIGAAVEEGYIAKPLVANEIFDRVPYAFDLQILDNAGHVKNDFVLMSVHLHWDADGETPDESATKRKAEIQTMFKWMNKTKTAKGEKDFFIVGDMNIHNQDEINSYFTGAASTMAFSSLNLQCVPSNMKLNECYDQVIFSKQRIDKIKPKLFVTDIAKKFDADSFESSIKFSTAYSDHNLVYFKMKIVADDD